MPVSILVGKSHFALVDEIDWWLVARYRWRVQRSGNRKYARAHQTMPDGSQRDIGYMHRLITAADKGTIIDHRDGDGLNNTRQNLRFCTNAENVRNQVGQPHKRKSKYKGVYRLPCGPWHAQINCDGKKHHLGYYPTEQEAAQAYNEAATKLHGAFARLNQIPGAQA